MDVERANKEITRLAKLEKTGNMDAVLIGARQLLKNYPNNISIRSNAAALIIDAGNYLKDVDALDQGIEILEQMIDNESESDNKAKLLTKYNLSNAYSGKSGLLNRKGRNEESVAARKITKDLLQQVLLERGELDTKLESMAITNYASVLDKFDRTVEAIDEYYDCISMTPNQGVAMGNCGIAIKRLIPISDNHLRKNVYAAWSMLSKVAVDQDAVLQFANPKAVEWYTDHFVDLEKRISGFFDGGVDYLLDYQKHREVAHGKPAAEEWLATINHDRLLLTLNLSPLDSEQECNDDLFFTSLTSKFEEGPRDSFSILASTFNSIKEDYATARYLYYYSENSSDYRDFGAITRYAETLDYAELGLSSGLLKASFRLAADCLDKIGVFINLYFNLNHPSDKIYFSNVWYKNLRTKTSLHPAIESIMHDNEFIRALLSLKEDWYLQAFPSAQLRDIRNIATHRGLTLHMLTINEEHSDSTSWPTDKFREIAFFMLRLTKAAITYTVLAMEKEERKKRIIENEEDFIPSFEFNLRAGWADERY